MYKIFVNSLLPIAFIGLISSCSTKKSVLSQQESTNPELFPQSTSLFIRPLIADLDISSEKKSIVYIADISLPFNDLRANALKDFMETYSCDYIVDPHLVRTTTKINGVLNEVEYKLTGYPAVYSNIYQVDSLPKSVMQMHQVQLPIDRVKFSTLDQRSLTGSMLGLEFASGLNFAGFQFDYKPLNLNWHFNIAIENYFNTNGNQWGSVTFNEIVNEDLFDLTGINSSMRSLSIGAFREKEIGKRLKIRGGAGLNVLDITFDSSLVNSTLQTRHDGARSYGLRVSAAIDYSLLPGFSLIGKAHSNIGLFNSIQQSGANSFEVQDINIENYPLLNFSLGIRFTF